MSILWMLLISVVIMQASVFVTTIYLHRSQCHRGLELHPLVQNLMHLEQVLFTGIVTREWVAVHRKHHHFSDKEGDPHSPYLSSMWNVFFNNFWMYRTETKNQATIRKYTPDYVPDLIDRIPFIDRLGAPLGLLIFMLMFGPAWGLGFFLFQAVGYIFLNASINSICHMIGYRNFDNKATNHQPIALLTGGEGLHNNHHEYPSSAKFALRKGEIDPAWAVIWMLERFGLAHVRPEPLAKAA